MEKQITLPSGATATLRDPATLRVKDRKRVFQQADKHGQGLMQALSLTDGLIAAMVKEWSLDLIIPSVKIESLDELEMADYDMLAEEAQTAAKILFPNLDKAAGGDSDPESPTVALNA